MTGWATVGLAVEACNSRERLCEKPWTTRGAGNSHQASRLAVSAANRGAWLRKKPGCAKRPCFICRTEREIAEAKAIQEKLLREIPQMPGYEIASACNLPGCWRRLFDILPLDERPGSASPTWPEKHAGAADVNLQRRAGLSSLPCRQICSAAG